MTEHLRPNTEHFFGHNTEHFFSHNVEMVGEPRV